MSHNKEAQRSATVNRREFLETSLTVGIAAAAAATLLQASPALAATAENFAPAPATASAARAFALEETTIAELQQGMSDGKMSAREIAERYLERIEKFDRKGARLNSIIELNPDALALAAELDRERKTKGARSPLHGIPILLKDNIDTADRMRTTAGSLALADTFPPRDAFIVERLRAAGAVLLGKTNLSEWANFRSSHSSSGWSGRGGQTRNPYAIDRNPCGSSSGSGVAVASNFAAAAIGTETDGSIVCPASACSLVGLKPTLGLVSRSGIIPIAHSQDTAGPMTRTVADAAAILNALTGIDPRDRATQNSRGKSHADYTRFLDPAGLRGARIGVARKFFGFNDKVDRLMTDAIDALKRAGAIVIDPADLPSHGKYDDSEFEVLLYEFKADLNKYLAERGGGAPRSLKEIIEFNERNREREMPYFGQELFLKAQEKGPLRSKAYLAALAKNQRLSRAGGIDAAIAKHRLDAIIAPTGGPPWMTDLVNGDHYTGGSSTPAAVAGYPNISVPAGYIFGLPVGISFFSTAYSEPVLIKLAYAYEQATKHRRPPQFTDSAELRD